MALSVPTIVIAVAVCTIAHLDSATGQRVVRWQDTGPGSRTISQHGAVAKHFLVDQIQITASILDERHSFAVRLEFTNAAGTELDLAPGLVELHVVRPRPTLMQAVPAAALAKRVRNDGNARAGAVELQGLAAMTTRTEQEPVVEVSPNPAAATDPTQPATIVTMNTRTVVKTVPDDSERSRTQLEGAALRHSANVDGKRIVDGALTAVRLAPGSRVVGAVYYERDDAAKEVLVRLLLPPATVEIPFTATKRRVFVLPRLVTFQ
jgi:hypothetical protein